MSMPFNVGTGEGKRYAVQLKGYPRANFEGWQNCVYSNDCHVALNAMYSLRLAPGCYDSRVFDRVDEVAI